MSYLDISSIVASDNRFWTAPRIHQLQLISPWITQNIVDVDCLARIEDALKEEYKERKRTKKRRLAMILHYLSVSGALESSKLPAVPSRVPRPSVLPSSPRGYQLLSSINAMRDHLWNTWLSTCREIDERYLAFVLVLALDHGVAGPNWIRNLSRLTWGDISSDGRIYFPVHWLDDSARRTIVHLTSNGRTLIEHIRNGSSNTGSDQFVFIPQNHCHKSRARDMESVLSRAYDRFLESFLAAYPTNHHPDWAEFGKYAPLIALFDGLDHPWLLTAYRQVPLASSVMPRFGVPLLAIDQGQPSDLICTVSPRQRSHSSPRRTWSTVPVQPYPEDENIEESDWCGSALQLLRQMMASIEKELHTRATAKKAEQLRPLFEHFRQRADAIAPTSSALHLAIKWAEYKLIEQRDLKPESLRKYLRVTFEEYFLTDPRSYDLSTWTREDHAQLVDRMLEVRRAPATTAFILDKLGQLYGFAVREDIVEEAPEIPHTGKWVGGSGRPWMIGLSQFDAFIRILIQRGTREDRMLAAAAILGFYAGLRADEVVSLTLKEAYANYGELWIWVWNGKSTAARRSIPLHLIAPDSAIDVVREWITERRTEFREDAVLRTIGLFGPPGDRDRYDYDSLIGNTIAELKYHFGDGIDFHTLRHSFASHFLLRWYGARYADFAGTLSDGGHELYEQPARRKLSHFFTLARYDDLPPHVPSDLVMISKLIGHSGLETFFATYVHSLDAIQRHVADRVSRIHGQRVLSGKVISVLFPGLRSRTSQARLASRKINDLVAHCLDGVDNEVSA